jgi:hypothetical protein
VFRGARINASVDHALFLARLLFSGGLQPALIEVEFGTVSLDSRGVTGVGGWGLSYCPSRGSMLVCENVVKIENVSNP